MIYELEVTHLRNYKIVRPLGAMGTCGFHPKAWQAAVIKKRPRETAVSAFWRANPNWKEQEVKT